MTNPSTSCAWAWCLSSLVGMIPLPAISAARLFTEPVGDPSVVQSGNPENYSNAVLSLSLEAPFHRIINDRIGDPEYHAGTLSYSTDDGSSVQLPVDVRTRGKTRRKKKICSFPPLRLRFATEDAVGTPFAGQKTFKLVTHCQSGDHAEQLVLQEYLAYRLYNLLTDFSFRARLARLSYRQPNGKELTTRYGIVLEHWKSIADRTGVVPVDAEAGIDVTALSPTHANRFALFQYLIGNEDFSMLWPERNEACCHNAKPLFQQGLVIPVPYDFDFAGIVDAPYAVPRPPNRDVRHRRYGGLCSGRETLAESLDEFRSKQAAIYALYQQQAGLSDHQRRTTLTYLEEFFQLIDDPDRVRSRLYDSCEND